MQEILGEDGKLARHTSYGDGKSPAHYCVALSSEGSVEERFTILRTLYEADPQCILVKNYDDATPYCLAMGIRGKHHEFAQDIATWLEEKMVEMGRMQLGDFGWFPPITKIYPESGIYRKEDGVGSVDDALGAAYSSSSHVRSFKVFSRSCFLIHKVMTLLPIS